MKKRNQKRDQRKREQKNARRKAVHAKRSGLAPSSPSLVQQARAAASAFGVNYCMVTGGLFDLGIGYVVLGRTNSPSTVATAVLLVDVFCLGVKNGFYAELTHVKFLDMVDGLAGMDNDNPLVDIDPPCARRIVAGAVAYAEQLGFAPHDSYPPAEALFGDIDAGSCPTEYVFGKDGKPFFVSGPHDTPAKIRKVMRTLFDGTGEGNFDYMLGVDDP